MGTLEQGAHDPTPAREPEARDAPRLPPHFLSRLAHDIRSPLGLLSGALEEIRSELSEHLDEGHQRMLTLAERGLMRLDRMARTLSTIAQIEGGTLVLSRERIDLARMLREVLESVERDDPRRGLDIVVELPEEVWSELDPERAREALCELIGQARRQAKARVKIALSQVGDKNEIRIEDDGRGTPAGEREHAFDRNYEPSDRRGTGFGLSVSRDLVRLHGGDVVLRDASLPASRPGFLGSCFVVTFPS
jgi:signal transduction histidine kinase